MELFKNIREVLGEGRTTLLVKKTRVETVKIIETKRKSTQYFLIKNT